MAGFFPSLQPSVSNNLWFDLKGGSVVEDDLKLLKEETEYNETKKREVNQGQDITPMGQAKQKAEDIGEEDEDIEEEEEEESNDEDTDIGEDTDGVDSIEEDMMTTSEINESNIGW